MELILKQYDIPLLRFSATNDSSTPEIEVHWINEYQRHLLPLDMELSPEGISRWMRRRTIPRNRAYVNRLLAKCGLNVNRPMGILALCKGLSVDDSYWVVEDGFEGTFEKYNLFENRFSEVLALIAFTGGLGAGKTAFCEGLAKGLGCTDPVSSPTFAIVNYYRGPRPFAHFDLYRISTENDLCAAGFYDYLDEGAVVAAEWSENFADLLALENPIRVNIERLDDTTRKITIEGVTV